MLYQCQKAAILRYACSIFVSKHIWDILLCLEDEIKENSLYAGKFYQETLVSQLLILLNRAALNQQSIYPDNTCQNEKILFILDYINKHLSDNLTIDNLSERFSSALPPDAPV